MIAELLHKIKLIKKMPLSKKQSNDLIQTIKKTLSSAEILALGSTPIELVPAPGSGKAILVLESMGRLNFNTTAYTTNLVLSIHCAGADASQENIFGLLGGTLTKIASGGAGTSTAGETQIIANTGIVAKVNAGNPLAGDSTIDLYVTYRVITL